ncbi:MAG: S8 family serine peptidase, partial [Clostridium sp.]|nr:S8 family serine peptidase [Clostridium sp.]
MSNNELKYIPFVAVIDSGVAKDCSYKEDICGGISLWIEGNDLIMSDDYLDEFGHGTQVCSMIKKVCPNALLYIVKIYKHEEISSSYLLLQALEHLLTVDVSLINISLSVAGTTFVNEIDETLCKLRKQNKVVISSVKN